MATTSLGSMSTLFEGRRPSPITPPPSGGEIKKLRERLLKHNKDNAGGLTEAACEFLAAAVTSPGAVRQQLSRPNIRPTATGHLEVIYATVPIDCLSPDPTNGRVVGATAWPASDLDAGQTLKLWAPADMSVHPKSPCEVLLTCESLSTIKTVIEDAAENTRKLNPKMEEKVKRDGILDPLLCQLTHIETMDRQRGVALVTRDGSTRCSFAKQAHRASPHDAFFGAARDVDHRRQRWIEMRRRAERPIEAVPVEELIELRTFLVDVQIVVGFHSEDQGVTAIQAVDDIVRRTHVETTHPWQPIAQSNSEADQMLSALRARGVIGDDQFLLYGGTLPRSVRAERRLPVEPDRVVAELMKSLGASETRRAQLDDLHTKMRAVHGRGQIRTTYKAELVGALGLRQFHVDPRSLETAHLTLGEALALDGAWELPWADTARSPEQLRDAALEELRDEGQPGCACRELAVKAVGHMAAQGWLKREARDTGGGFRDQRPADTVLELMHACEQGVHTLAEALAAGRRGETARAVRVDGEVVERAAGDVHPITNQWLRETFADDGGRDKPSAARSAQEPTGATTPREKIAEHMLALDRFAADLAQELEQAAHVRDDDGESFLSRRGWTAAEVEPLAMRLRRTADRLTRYGMIAEVNPGLPPVQELDVASAAAEAT
jgi:hypothetical protein